LLRVVNRFLLQILLTWLLEKNWKIIGYSHWGEGGIKIDGFDF